MLEKFIVPYYYAFSKEVVAKRLTPGVGEAQLARSRQKRPSVRKGRKTPIR